MTLFCRSHHKVAICLYYAACQQESKIYACNQGKGRNLWHPVEVLKWLTLLSRTIPCARHSTLTLILHLGIIIKVGHHQNIKETLKGRVKVLVLEFMFELGVSNQWLCM